jgi:hypothetical protein
MEYYPAMFTPRNCVAYFLCLYTAVVSFAPAASAQGSETGKPTAPAEANPCLAEQQLILDSLKLAEQGDYVAAYKNLRGSGGQRTGDITPDILGSRVTAVAGFLKNVGKTENTERFLRHALKQKELMVQRGQSPEDRAAIIIGEPICSQK